MRIDDISGIVVDEAVAIHRELGPGLFETVYETILAGRLEARGSRLNDNCRSRWNTMESHLTSHFE